MALTLIASAPSGASGSYWRVIHCTLDAANQTTKVATALYVDKAARENGKDPLFVRQDSFSYSAFVGTENSVVVAYDALKQLPDFTGAVDC